MQATPLKKSNDIRIAANPDWEIIIQSVLINGHLEKSPTNSKSYTRRGQDPFAGSESTSESAWTMLII